MRKIIVFVSVLSLVLGPSVSFAQTVDIAAIERTIAIIEKQLGILKGQLAQLKAAGMVAKIPVKSPTPVLAPDVKPVVATPEVKTTPAVSTVQTVKLTKPLTSGAEGAEVKVLQAALLLAGSDVLTLNEITDYFGSQTRVAIKKFQEVNGLDQLGTVGPATRAALNTLLESNPILFEKTGRLCAKLADGAEINPVWVGKNGPLFKVCSSSAVAVIPLPPVPTPAPVSEPAPIVTAPIYVPPVYTPPAPVTDGLVSSPNGPVMSNLRAANMTPSSVQIAWDTDRAANSKVYWSSITPILTGAGGNSVLVENPAMEISHGPEIFGLNSNTKYYYKAVSTDASGNRTVSAEMSFRTQTIDAGPIEMLQEPQAVDVTRTSARVYWKTNNQSTSRIRYSRTSPIPIQDDAVTFTVDNGEYVTDHSMILNGLQPGVRYFFNVSSVGYGYSRVNSANQQFFDTLP